MQTFDQIAGFSLLDSTPFASGPTSGRGRISLQSGLNQVGIQTFNLVELG